VEQNLKSSRAATGRKVDNLMQVLRSLWSTDNAGGLGNRETLWCTESGGPGLAGELNSHRLRLWTSDIAAAKALAPHLPEFAQRIGVSP
jgi:hypothetical protein